MKKAYMVLAAMMVFGNLAMADGLSFTNDDPNNSRSPAGQEFKAETKSEGGCLGRPNLRRDAVTASGQVQDLNVAPATTSKWVY